MKKCCGRKSCFAYCERKDNNCAALSSVYNNDKKCPFYKRRNEVDETTKELISQSE